ncbi:hypothetical protein WJX74_005389 [Apatococcus lobatus]|uniref:BPL/LPL catalytic domain-containing protein n=1 Tax=Apatococcus lobatus TaxID=904363 RepID=A0AAW1QXS8_9CHLO
MKRPLIGKPAGFSRQIARAMQQAISLTVHTARPDQAESVQSSLGTEVRLQKPDQLKLRLVYGAAEHSEATFKAAVYLEQLPTSTLGQVVLVAADLPSTQNPMQELAKVLPDGTVCIADRQTAGRGRGGNKWESPAGCMLFSVNAKLTIEGRLMPFVQYTVCLAIVQAIQEAAVSRLQGATLDVRIKWPNDLMAEGLKLGGILCHSAYSNRQFVSTIGIGINLANRQPTTCVDSLIEAAHAKAGLSGNPRPVTREELLARILGHLEKLLQTLMEQGFSSLQPAYEAAWLHSGQKVTLEEDTVGGPAEQIQVTILGLAPNGYLLATDASGQRFELHPDGNSLDFMKGLVRRKLST